MNRTSNLPWKSEILYWAPSLNDPGGKSGACSPTFPAARAADGASALDARMADSATARARVKSRRDERRDMWNTGTPLSVNGLRSLGPTPPGPVDGRRPQQRLT